MPEPLSPVRRLAYACGSPGFQISDRIVVAILLYFYLPPGGSDLVPQISQEIFFGGLTAFGAAMLIGRVFDSLADPIVGHGSDRSRSRMGRRRSYLLWGIVPMTAIPVLGFWPPGPPGSTLNFIWLTAVVAAYFVFFTVYVAPYLALLPEVAWRERQRVELSTLMGIVSFPVVGFFSFAWTVAVDWGASAGMDATTAIRWVVVVSSLVGFALCALPILAVDERRHARSTPSDLPLWQAFTQTLRNRPFRIYLAAQVFFVLGLNMATPALPYFAEVLLGRSLSFTANLGGALFACTIVSFGFVGPLTRRFGPRRMLVFCVAVFALALFAFGLIEPDVPGGQNDAANLFIAFGSVTLMGIPIAGFVVLPTVVMGQVIDYDERRTGANRSAMYFGIQGFLTKWVYGLSAATLAFLFARFGNSPEEPLGVMLVGPVAGVACLIAAMLFALYPEDAVKRDGEHAEP